MLILSQYDISLQRLTSTDTELVRSWRNQDRIRNQMFYADIISEQEQELWFDSINNPLNYYFIIVFKSRKIGLIHAKNIDLILEYGEGGIFIGEVADENSWAATMASICLLSFVFEKLSLKSSVIKVKSNNLNAIKYNELLGYKEVKRDENCTIMSLDKKSFNRATSKLKNTLSKISGGNEKMILSGTPSDLNLSEINKLLK